jgi:hypothetical protein
MKSLNEDERCTGSKPQTTNPQHSTPKQMGPLLLAAGDTQNMNPKHQTLKQMGAFWLRVTRKAASLFGAPEGMVDGVSFRASPGSTLGTLSRAGKPLNPKP